jgi:hypothetical protein
VEQGHFSAFQRTKVPCSADSKDISRPDAPPGDLGYAIGALTAGIIADAFGFAAAIAGVVAPPPP